MRKSIEEAEVLATSPIYAYVPVKDIARGKQFYEGVLGFEPQMEIEGAGVAYQCGGGTAFFMYLTDGAGTNKASTAFWKVDDIETSVEELAGQGVVFEDYDVPGMPSSPNHIYGSEGSRAAWFKDPDGNVLALISDK